MSETDALQDQPPGEKGGAALDPRRGTAGTRLLRGAGYLARGWGFVFSRHPSLLRLFLLPVLINIVVFAGVAVGLYLHYGDIVNLIWVRPESWFFRTLWYLLYVFILLAVLLLAYFAFFVVQAMLAAPFNDLLSERTELLAYGKRAPSTGISVLIGGVGRSVTHEVAKLGIYVAMMVPLFVASLVIPVVGNLAYVCLGFYGSAVFFAYDFIDFCMARRQWSFRRKWAFLKQHRALTVGFGSALAGGLLIPVVGLLIPPVAAVGGTLLFCDLETHDPMARDRDLQDRAP